MDNKAYLALGTNIEPRYEHLKHSLEILGNHKSIKVIKKSSIYQTAPVGYTDQNDFLNMVVQIETTLTATELLTNCQRIEQQLGRKREIRFGPRTIDLDILLYNEENRKSEQLTIPHPRMHERAFVLIPLEEIAPGILLPSRGESVRELVNKLSKKDMKDVMIWTRNGLEDE
ncbi:2-amino-4-hydroxy-6-hydroxymethyldihydropteridine diphosphokinase [Ornithinibacillus sp. L9]|uniref:2-amino-4-hydroxy-6-hydroxymethyldihydropteridine diphosphokinase n=1 Tax=Ornithinibacillus caprae TaxID=2678566 RepID=A0A6N8FJ96_9BACI|nr:2-amino-4-hydroxy-6-hydroxymethyldihydropteridine diphosphokinase [Ornithinibacillus caprae]MUK88047.1 2-amino-4-hydroxy-6-hydroxymethyldihydropteridine diphosphokinase [Ornithinibacillus caprae]